MKKNIFSLDPFLTILVFIFSIIGLLNFFSASFYFSLKNFNNPYFYFERFLTRITLLGFLFFLIGNFFGQRLQSYKKLFFLIFILLYFSLFLGFISKFRLEEPTARWVNLGFVSFQPSELIKPFALLIFIFLFPALRKLNLSKITFIFLIFLAFLISPIFFQPALSNSLVILLSLLSIFFLYIFNLPYKQRNFKEILISFSIILFLIIALLLLSTKWEYRKERFLSFLTKGKLYEEKYFQLEQALLGVSSGGIFGKGIGKSEIKILGLPQMLTDSIFVIYAEETGFVGSIFLLLLYFLLILRIILLGIKNSELEKKAFCLGTSVWIFLQVFLHIGSNIGLIVPTGVVLPFLSYGASSELAIYFSLGIISSFKNA